VLSYLCDELLQTAAVRNELDTREGLGDHVEAGAYTPCTGTINPKPSTLNLGTQNPGAGRPRRCRGVHSVYWCSTRHPPRHHVLNLYMTTGAGARLVIYHVSNPRSLLS
jgi:hypothetical protein